MCNLVGGVMTPPYEALNNNLSLLQRYHIPIERNFIP